MYRADEATMLERQNRAKLIAFGGATLAGLAALVGLIVWVWSFLMTNLPEIPDSDRLWTMGRPTSVEYVSTSGELIAVRGPRYGRAVKVDSLPQHVVDAFLAIEDRRFFDHNGIDMGGIARAFWVNLTTGRTVQGGSTLTQQLVKNLFLGPERTLKRKVEELRLALGLEERLSKDAILELYLNRIFLGANAYGLDGAARRYFGKTAETLTLAEAAMLAGLPKAPGRLAPTLDSTAAKARQQVVLTAMVDAGFITPTEAQAAAAAEVTFADTPENPDIGYILDFAAARLEDLNLGSPDLVVTLTVDPRLQDAADTALNAIVAREGPRNKFTQASAVLMSFDGAVRAMVGGTDYTVSKFNRVTQARRQPGSTFKTFVYAAAFERGKRAFTVRIDQPVSIDGWRPQNYGREFLGPMTLIDAFAYSTNTIAAALGEEIGQEAVVGMALRLGITTPLQPVPSVSLGSSEVTLYDMTRAFAAFPNAGVRVDPYVIEAVHDTRGRQLYVRPGFVASEVLRPEIASAMTRMMRRVVTAGTGQRARVEGIETAGKTGTSQDWRDAWFVGFSSRFAAGVWVGNDDNSPMARQTGGAVPAQLFADLIKLAHEGAGAERLPGLNEDADKLDPVAQERLDFYRNLAMAFSTLAPREVATVRPTTATP